MIQTKIGRRGQLTIPKEIRLRVHLDEGDAVAFIVEGDQLRLHPIRKTLLDLRGSITVSGEQDFDAIQAEATRSRAEKRGRDAR
ncbi:MAG: AbrB/MazE/SpoVT family DNA-binding domain-containing protein [Acidobacteria bacterium]|nr:AbrB/MazE/SpoVT family DNA-binding domain-containing protein [Acidobacteriota bacterium]